MPPPPLLGVWGSSAKAAVLQNKPLPDWLITRFNQVGLDGQICAEYIFSLVQMYASVAADRCAAITDFLADSLTQSTVPSANRNRFIEETVKLIEQYLGGASVVVSPPVVSQPPVTVMAAEPVIATSASTGFKKGTKISGTALKKVVGNLRPSYVQRYSDDEDGKTLIPSSSVSNKTTPPNESNFSDKQYFPNLSGAKNNTRKSKGAIEIGPDEEWPAERRGPSKSASKSPMKKSEKTEKNSDKSLKSTPIREVSRPMYTPCQEDATFVSVEEPQAREDDCSEVSSSCDKEIGYSSQTVEAPAEVVEQTLVLLEITKPLETTPVETAPIMIIPENILNFDFQFEDEDEEGVIEDALIKDAPIEVPEQQPFELFKQMFTSIIPSPVVVNDTTRVEDQDVAAVLSIGATDHQEDQSVCNVHPALFLLNVLSDMRKKNLVKVPTELKHLTYQPQQGNGGLSSNSWRNNPDAVPHPQWKHKNQWQTVPNRKQPVMNPISDGVHEPTVTPPPAAAVTHEGFW